MFDSQNNSKTSCNKKQNIQMIPKQGFILWTKIKFSMSTLLKQNYFSCHLIISRSRRLVIMSHFWHSNSLYFEIVCNSCSWNNKIAPTALRKRDKSGCKIQLLRSALVCIFFFQLNIAVHTKQSYSHHFSHTWQIM